MKSFANNAKLTHTHLISMLKIYP